MARTRQSAPTTLLSLAICCHMIAYVIVCVAAFTPEWSSVTEDNGVVDITYDKGVFVSCNVPNIGPTKCGFTRKISDSSSEFFICFLLFIASIVMGFFTLQIMCCGICVNSIKTKNLGIPLTVLFFVLAMLLVACIVLFEVSITKDVTDGHDYVESTVGLSRILLAVAIGLYIVCTFFTLGEHMKRKNRTASSVGQDDDAYSVDSLPKTPDKNNDDNTSKKSEKQELDKEKSIVSNKSDKVEKQIVEEKTEKVAAAPITTNANNNNNTTSTNRTNSFRNERKFSKKENRMPAPFSDAGYNPTRRANTSIVPLEGHTYFK